MLLSIRIVPVCDDFQAPKFLTADCADEADKGREIFDHLRYPRNPRLSALTGPLVAASGRGAKYPGALSGTPVSVR
jgi:hypothetical protein